MTDGTDRIEGEALDWVVRLREPAFADWEGFTAWLEAEPRHSAAYDRMAIAEAAIGPLIEALPAPVIAPARPARRWIGWAAAASIAAVAGGLSLREPVPNTYAVETAPGSRRSVTLADGSRIEMNGATRLVLDREGGRTARLERGEAVFTVAHNAADPFRVMAGDVVLEDAGTIFNVVRAGGSLTVAVAEGAVIYNPGREGVRLDPGQALRVAEAGGEPRLARTEPAEVASWRAGRLIYHGAPVGVVAADLTRNLGVSVSANPDVAMRSFTGVIALDGDRDRLFPRIGALMGVNARRDGPGWRLVNRARADR